MVPINALRQSVESIREQVGDMDVRWHHKWTAPLQRLVMASLRKDVEDRRSMEHYVANYFLVNFKLAVYMSRLVALEYLIAEFAQQFLSIGPS